MGCDACIRRILNAALRDKNIGRSGIARAADPRTQLDGVRRGCAWRWLLRQCESREAHGDEKDAESHRQLEAERCFVKHVHLSFLPSEVSLIPVEELGLLRVCRLLKLLEAVSQDHRN